jgi:hypothetical protein
MALNALPRGAGRRIPAGYPDKLDRYVGVLDTLFTAVSEVAGSDLIVDTSKAPSFATLIARVPNVDLRIVHLVRDSRGMAYSWEKQVLRRDRPGSTAMMMRYRPTASALRYSGYNLQSQALARVASGYVRLRYEDIVRDPVRHMVRLAEFVGADTGADALSFVTPTTVTLGANHAVAANPMRHDHGAVPLKIDDEWQTKMRKRTRLVVTALTSPMLRGYGYPLSGVTPR